MNILVVALGSIGQRHLKNILSLGYKNISVVTRKDISSIYPMVEIYKSLEDALNTKTFDTAIICSPTSFHLNALIPLLQKKTKNIYLEKPVSHNLKDIDKVLDLVDSYDNRIVIGYDLHFDPGLMKVRELIDSDVIGNIVSVNAFVGQYLPDWRPYEDYRKGMSARKETGGGVMLDLIHEFDYISWLFGKTKRIVCFYGNTGSLEIETEDNSNVLFEFESGVSGTLHLDYLQQVLRRDCIITGSKGTIVLDLAKSNVSWINETKERNEFNYSDYERNDRFVEIMKVFLSQKEDARLTPFREGLRSLINVVRAKEASEKIIIIN